MFHCLLGAHSRIGLAKKLFDEVLTQIIEFLERVVRETVRIGVAEEILQSTLKLTLIIRGVLNWHLSTKENVGDDSKRPQVAFLVVESSLILISR